MAIRKTLIGLFVATLGILSAPADAKAISLSYLETDQAFKNLNVDLLFVAEGRIGSSNNSTYELDLHDDTGSTNFAVQKQQELTGSNFWQSGRVDAFTLAYDALTKIVTYKVGNQTLAYDYTSKFTQGVTDIFVRTRANNTNSSMTVKDLLLKDASGTKSIAETSSVSCTLSPNCTTWYKDANGNIFEDVKGGVQYLRIGDVSGSFSLTGNSIMSWTGKIPTQSNLAYQIKVGTTDDWKNQQSVPEPSATLGLTLGAIALGLKTRRRRQSV
ncbi:PEP-CTERM sorting domain-containing protein [Coleofasciculus sp. FACHB-542]|uniref:PEP-CTERM sorting domain-containing protein n=1 Tax=Coleofasciculus sp. FACHB-542 TaxID=2692787 RepID=UPI0016889FD6|nr:PEP-CTERM sorting domain-containing protein [Coleofasciculus sp. FACHB-542]MBD2087399.1 PEP-CTERM sorting domain-containing protein [Coleofasciculus sp. FACHB-542]